MHQLHGRLENKYDWYKNWHAHPLHNHLHWLFFLTVSILAVFFISSVASNYDKALEFLSTVSAEQTIDSRGLMKGKIITQARDRILVQFKGGISETKQKEILDRQNLNEKETIRGTKVKIISLPQGKDPVEVAETLKKDESSSLDFVETDDLISPEFIPNDPYYPSQWHLPKIEAPIAWDSASAPNSLVAICDTGIEANHEDLAPVLRTDLGFNTVDNSTNWTPVHYHGTLVAGAAAAVVNNSLGVAGVGREAKIIPVRISNLSDGGAYLSDAAECISYSADNGAKAINLSYRMAGYSTIDSAASYAEGKGATTVVAAGNDGVDPAWPDFSTFLAVGATDQNDTRTSWSNYGNYIDIVAPGLSILTTYIGNQYSYASGTSLAAPLVVGTIALLSGAKADISPSEVKNILYITSDDLGDPGDDNIYGQGRLNARKAVEKLVGSATPSAAPSPTLTLTPTASPSATLTPIPDNILPTVSIIYPTTKSKISPNSTITITAAASDNIGIKEVDIRVSTVTNLPRRQVKIDRIHQCIDDTDPYTCIWNVPNQKNVTYLIQAIAYDLAGNSDISSAVQFTAR